VDTVTSLNQQTSNEWVKLLRKLRWIGLEEEARNLEPGFEHSASGAQKRIG
jgi:hypothetical protein